MNKKFYLLPITSALLLLLTVSCGGGGGGNGADGGIGGTGITGISAGQIQRFGSVFVNGVEWETESAEIEFEGIQNPLSDDLQLGMFVAATWYVCRG